MHELIERYIHDVTRRLPEKERGEIRLEIEASISDMLPDDPGENDIVDALTQLGAPRLLAEQYRKKPRYLISPAMFELYISVLKLVVPIVAVVLAGIGIITGLSSYFVSVGEVISAAISAAFEGALQAAFWVTIGFAIADHSGIKQKPWTVGDLPKLPDQGGAKIPRSSSIVEMALAVFFTALFIVMILRGEPWFILVRGAEIITPFTRAALERFVPYLVLFGVMSLVINSLKLFWARWNVPLCIANIVYQVVWVSVVIYALHWQDLWNPEFTEFASTLFDDVDILRLATTGRVALILSVFFVAIAAIDVGVSVHKTWKGTREPG